MLYNEISTIWFFNNNKNELLRNVLLGDVIIGYNGMFNPDNKNIYLLGGENSTDLERWIYVLNHEIYHAVLSFMGINIKHHHNIINLIKNKEKNYLKT